MALLVWPYIRLYVQKLRKNYCKNVTFRFITTVYKYSTKVLFSFYRLNDLKKLHRSFSGLDILPRMEYDDDEIYFDAQITNRPK